MTHGTSSAIQPLIVESSLFANNEMMPSSCTCDGVGYNPPLNIGGMPEETKTLALIVEDPDAPSGTYTHWIVWNINPEGHIRENSVPGVQGMNDSGKIEFKKPCPPSGTHRYIFHVFALNNKLDLPESSSRTELEMAMNDKIIAKGQLIGKYKRK